MVMPGTFPFPEGPVDVTDHHRRRKLAHRAQARMFPENLSWYGQQWKLFVPLSADPISISVARRTRSLNDTRVEAAIGICRERDEQLPLLTIPRKEAVRP